MDAKTQQIKLNAITAKLLHAKAKAKWEFWNNLLQLLTVVVPILLIIALFVAKGSAYEALVNTISFILSIVLIALAVVALIYQFGDRIVLHKIGVKNNIYVDNECDEIAKSTADNSWFYRYVAEIDTQDKDAFPNVPDETRKSMYRQAIKEFEPGDYTVVCPMCKKSPWQYQKGDCQLCGNKTN